MQNITNPKIEKQKDEIEKTKAKIAGYQNRQREQERHLRMLEDMEIVAQFRAERISDGRLPDAMRSGWNEIQEDTEDDE